MAGAFADFAQSWLPRVEAALESLVPSRDTAPADLHAAMRHALFPGGKRLRPLLALIAARVTGGDVEKALHPAAALELLHTYSLVHDDLPCMDDDALRRGRPTVHVAFTEALAVLAGDALLTLAFEAVAPAGSDAIQALARASGSLGMVGGQAEDLAAEGSATRATIDDVRRIHDKKTGALITASFEVGALAGGASFDRDALRRFGALLGRAFQIADDCLDVTGTAQETGKRTGKDQERGKLTYPGVIGLAAARAQAEALAAEAAALAPSLCNSKGDRSLLDADRKLLQDLAFRVVARTS